MFVHVVPSHVGGPLRSAAAIVSPAVAPNVTFAGGTWSMMWRGSSQRAGLIWHSLQSTCDAVWIAWAPLVGPLGPWQVTHAVGPSAWHFLLDTFALPPSSSVPWQPAQVAKLQFRRASSLPWNASLAGSRIPAGWTFAPQSAHGCDSSRSSEQLARAKTMRSTHLIALRPRRPVAG